MSRENPKKYPRSVESKHSFLRIRAPEHLDIALEGLIRKVLKEQPKMDDIYAFAADYFDMLLKLREKAGIRKLSVQDICPHHNEDDAHEMIKLASSFAKRNKPHPNTYRALTLRNADQSKYERKPEKLESNDLENKSQTNEDSDRAEYTLTDTKENAGKEIKNESVECDSNESEISYSIKASGQEVGEEVFIKANEVITKFSAEDEESPRETVLGNGVEPVGDIDELRDKIKAVENEIKLLDEKDKTEDEIVDDTPAGEILEENTNKPESGNEKPEENEVGSVTGDVKETDINLTEETKELQVDSTELEQQEPKLKTENILQSRRAETNEDNADASDASMVENLKEAQDNKEENAEDSQKSEIEANAEDINKNADNAEESQKSGTDTGMQETDSETHETNVDSAEKMQETKPELEVVEQEVGSEIEEVKPSGDGEEETEETKERVPEKQTEDQEVQKENSTAVKLPSDPVQAVEMEVMGEKTLKSQETENKMLIAEEKEAVQVPNSETADAQVTEKEEKLSQGETSENQEENAEVQVQSAEKNSESEETTPPEKENINVAGIVAGGTVPVLLGLNELTKNTEAEVGGPPSEMELLQGGEPQNSVMTVGHELEKFLNSEREHSSLEKKTEDLKLSHEAQAPTAETDPNPVESIITSRTISKLGTINENELVVGDHTSENAPETTQKPNDVELDDRDGSTTSDEIEFEISPDKKPETDISEKNPNVVEPEEGETHEDVKIEPEIVLELNDVVQGNEEKVEEREQESNNAFLQVPGLILDEKIVRKADDNTPETEPVIEKSEDEIILECGNIGNEIIQKREVEKVELVEGEEDILQVHLTTTFETEQDQSDSVHVQMTSRIEPNFKVSVETKVESPVQDERNVENMKLVRAAIVIQNGFRRFKNRKISGEVKQDDKQINGENILDLNESEFTAPTRTSDVSNGDKILPTEKDIKRTLDQSETRTLFESQSLDSIRKISPLKTRSLSSVRYGVADFEVWNQLVKELEEAATKIQSNYRGYKTRKKLQRGNAVQSNTTTSGDSICVADVENSQRHTGEFHDTLVLPLDPK